MTEQKQMRLVDAIDQQAALISKWFARLGIDIMESRGSPIYYSSTGFMNSGSKGTPAQTISYYV